jgi:hypothetical protein
LEFGQRSDRFRQLIRKRYTRITEQHRDYKLVELEGRRNLFPYEVLALGQPFTLGKPTPADYYEYHLGLRELLFQHLLPMAARPNAVHIEEQLKVLPQAVEQAASEPLIITAAILIST